MNTAYRIGLPGTMLDYFDARSAVNAIREGAWEGLPYTSRVLAENLVRRCDPEMLTESLKQLIERHLRFTGSQVAARLLANWEKARGEFVKVFPHEYRRALAEQAPVRRAMLRSVTI